MTRKFRIGLGRGIKITIRIRIKIKIKIKIKKRGRMKEIRPEMRRNIGSILGVTESTIKKHVQKMFEKLGSRDTRRRHRARIGSA